MRKSILNSMEVWGKNIPEKDFRTGIKLLKKLFNKQITKDEFLKECTYFTMQCGFDELRPKQLPARPKELLDYDEKKVKNSKYEVDSDFWRQPAIRAYIESKSSIIATNLGNKAWLEENLARLISYGDPVFTGKVRERLREFKEWEQDNWTDMKQWYKPK